MTSEILLRRETIEREEFLQLLDGKSEEEVFGADEPDAAAAAAAPAAARSGAPRARPASAAAAGLRRRRDRDALGRLDAER